jgi:hypothetical protein
LPFFIPIRDSKLRPRNSAIELLYETAGTYLRGVRSNGKPQGVMADTGESATCGIARGAGTRPKPGIAPCRTRRCLRVRRRSWGSEWRTSW